MIDDSETLTAGLVTEGARVECFAGESHRKPAGEPSKILMVCSRLVVGEQPLILAVLDRSEPPAMFARFLGTRRRFVTNWLGPPCALKVT